MRPITQSNTIFEMIVSDIKAATKNLFVLAPPVDKSSTAPIEALDLASTCFYSESEQKKHIVSIFIS